MGRYYKTARGGQLDFMKQLPVNLMMKGIEVADQANDQIYAQADLFNNQLAQIRYLTPDEDRVKGIQEGYAKEIDSVTKALMEDPANFRKQMPLVRGLSRKLTTDFNTGEIAAIQGNAAKMTQWDKTYAPLAASNKISPDAYRTMKQAFVRSYKGAGYDSNTGNYNQLQTEDVYQTQDFNKIINDNIKDIKANSKGFKQEADGGKWLVTNGGKEEWVSSARVAQLASDSLLGNQDVMGYLKQGGRYGYLKGVADSNGNFIQPYQLDSKGNPVFNDKSILAAPIRSAVGREAFRESSSESGMQLNPYAMEQVKFGNDVDKMKQADGIRDTNQVSDAELKWKYDERGIRLKAELAGKAKAAAAGAKTTKKTPTPGAKNIIRMTGSQDGVTAYQPFGGVNTLSLDGLQHEQRTSKEEVAELLALSKNPNLSVNERDNYQQRADEAEARVQKSYELLSAAKEYSNEKLLAKGYTPQEIVIANDKYNSTITPMKNRLSELNDVILKQTLPSGGPNPAPIESNPQLDAMYKERTKLQQNVNRMEAVHNDLQNSAKEWFKTNSEKTVQRLEGVGLGALDKEVIYKQMEKNPTRFALRQPDNEYEPDAYTTIFAEGGNPRKNIEIERINPPTAGIGITVSFRYKNKDGKPIGDTRLMTIPNSLNPVMSERLIGGKQANQKQLGETLRNEFKINFLSSIKNKINDSANPDVDQPSGYYSYYDEKNNYTSQIKVVPVTDASNANSKPVSYKVYATLMDGSYVPLPISKDKSNEFPSEESLADAFVGFATKTKK